MIVGLEILAYILAVIILAQMAPMTNAVYAVLVLMLMANVFGLIRGYQRGWQRHEAKVRQEKAETKNG